MNVIGFDIGGTKSAVILAETEKKVVTFYERKEIPTTSDWKKILELLCGEAEEMALAKGIEIKRCFAGISCGGPLSADRKMICSPPNLPGWDQVPVVEYLEKRLGIPACMENDADACALAEWSYGAGKGTSNMIFLTFGTGLGAGLILDGRLYRGSTGMAGEAGHIRMEADGPEGYGKKGSLEGFCSGGGIKRLAELYVERQRSVGRIPEFVKDREAVLTARLVADAAKAGDRDALEIFKISGRQFGRGLSVLIDLLNPEMIVAGSIYARCQELFDSEMYAVIEREALAPSRKNCKICPAQLGERIGDYGAVMAAVYGGGFNKTV